MNFIKKIVDGEVDESVHQQFQKFSKGEFRSKALIQCKRTAKNVKINTSPEFGNGLVKYFAEKLGEEKTNVSGAIVCTMDLEGKVPYKDKKQFQGVKRYIIDDEMSGSDVLNLVNEVPKAFFGLSFEVGDEKLKIKPKAPKSGKPSSKGEAAPKADFCRVVTTDKNLIESFVFENPNFKEANIQHTFFIDKIVIPDELKDSKDFALIREKSRRKGRILREAEIDGKKTEKEIEFEA